MKKFKYCPLWVVEVTIKETPIQWGTFKYLKDAKKQAITLAEFNSKVIGKNKFFTDKY
jgi:hypothetical protein